VRVAVVTRDESVGGELKLRSRVKPRNNELLIAGQVPDERTEKRQCMLMIRLN